MLLGESVSFELALEFLREAPVSLESSVLGLLVQSGVPVVEFVEAVSEAQTF